MKFPLKSLPVLALLLLTPIISHAQPSTSTPQQLAALRRSHTVSTSQKTAIPARRFENWTSIFVAPLGGLSGELLNNAAAVSGAYVASGPNKVLLNMNDRFINLHALQSERD